MKKPLIDLSFNAGTLLHLLGVIVALVLYGAAFDKRTTLLEAQIQAQSNKLDILQRQTNRLEHYLSSMDKNYWKRASENGDRE